MSLRFGTDGVRGVAFKELTTELSFALGRAAASVFSPKTIAVGRDTRESGPELQQALTDGIVMSGVEVIDLGVLPTPGIAYAAATLGVPAAVVSASHNPFHDNGIKFFAAGGRKLSAAEESAIESAMTDGPGAPGGHGSARDGTEFHAAYVQHLQKALDGRRLEGLDVVIDCANGAGSGLAAEVLNSLGASVTTINDQPDGRNINDGCGSTYLEPLRKVVEERRPAAAFALDGDADRVLAIDENGVTVDGDHILGMLAIDGKANGWLKDDTLVLTVMSNLGLRQSMQAHGVRLHETPVGDKYVLQALTENGWSLGGEQSGHVIVPSLASTGDGLLTALLILDLMQRTGKPLSALSAEAMTKLPQVLRNVRVERMSELKGNEVIATAVRQAQHALGGAGRVLLRPSGTEPLVRVMVEAPTHEQASEVVDDLIGVVVTQLGKG